MPTTAAHKSANTSLLIKIGHFAGYVILTLVTAGITSAWTVRGNLSEVHERTEINRNDIANARADMEAHQKELHDQIADLKADMVREFAEVHLDMRNR